MRVARLETAKIRLIPLDERALSFDVEIDGKRVLTQGVSVNFGGPRDKDLFRARVTVTFPVEWNDLMIEHYVAPEQQSEKSLHPGDEDLIPLDPSQL